MLIEAINRIKDRPRFEQFEVKVHSDEQFVYFSIKFKADQEAPMQGTLQLLLDAGLSELCKTQINSANLDIDANYDFQQIVNEMQKGERIGTAVLKQTKLEMNLFLQKKFYSEFAKIVQNTDAEMLESPPMAFLKHFKLLDLDLRFKSTDELPSLIKNQVLFGESFQSQNKQELELPITQIKQVKKIIDGAADQGQMYLTILGVGCVKLEATVPNLSVLLVTYGKILANLFGLGEFIPDSI